MSGSLMRGVNKQYGAKRVLVDVDLTAQPGSVVGVVGPNGSGKTTLLRILLGLVHPDSGTVRLLEAPPPPTFADHRVGFFAGGHSLPPQVRVGEWARLFGIPVPRAWAKRRFGRLSRGERQWAGLHVVLNIRDLQMVVLDEPWEGLDPIAADRLAGQLQQYRDNGAMVIVSSHRLGELVEICNSFAFLSGGRLVMRAGADLMADGRVSQERVRATYDELVTSGDR